METPHQRSSGKLQQRFAIIQAEDIPHTTAFIAAYKSPEIGTNVHVLLKYEVGLRSLLSHLNGERSRSTIIFERDTPNVKKTVYSALPQPVTRWLCDPHDWKIDNQGGIFVPCQVPYFLPP